MNKRTIKLNIRAGKASLQPPIGPILGQYGIPGAKFCQEFNDRTKNYDENIILNVKIILLNKKIFSINYSPNIITSLYRLIIANYQSNKINIKKNNIKKRIYNINDLLIHLNLNKNKRINKKKKKLLKLYIANKSQKFIQIKRKNIKNQLIYNYIYIEDIYNLRKSLKRFNNNIELNLLIKELIRNLKSMQIYIIRKNI